MLPDTISHCEPASCGTCSHYLYLYRSLLLIPPSCTPELAKSKILELIELIARHVGSIFTSNISFVPCRHLFDDLSSSTPMETSSVGSASRESGVADVNHGASHGFDWSLRAATEATKAAPQMSSGYTVQVCNTEYRNRKNKVIGHGNPHAR